MTAPSTDVVAGTPSPTAPVVARTRAELRTARRELDRGDVAVVMTMGALHEGHAALIRARPRAGPSTWSVTIFLNPLQFGPGEDLSRYPRTVDTDLAICGREGVDLVFAPTPDVVYPDGDPGVRVSAGALGDVLEGQSRPGPLRRRADRRRQAAAPDRRRPGATSARRTPSSCCSSGGWCGPRLPGRGGRRADGARAGRAGHEQPQHLPHRRRPGGRRCRCPGRCAAGAAAATEGPAAVRRAARAVLVRRAAGPGRLPRPGRTRTTLEDVPEWYRGEALLAVAARVGTTRLIDNLPVAVGPGGGALEVLTPAPARAASPASAPASVPAAGGDR